MRFRVAPGVLGAVLSGLAPVTRGVGVRGGTGPFLIFQPQANRLGLFRTQRSGRGS